MYKSRNGNIYYLYTKATSKGNKKYFLSTKKDSGALTQIPDNFEIYESPNGTVTLRKSFIRMFSQDEIDDIKNSMGKYCKNAEYIIDEKKDGIEIYVDEMYRKKLSIVELSILSVGEGKSTRTIYNPTFKLSKDPTIGEYLIERFFFLGGVQDWVYIERNKRLKYLCDKYFVHINKESFYELM